ncbi:putative senescence regulator S40 [Dioscorea sansibarensis]
MADEFEEEEVWAVMKERVVLEGRPKAKCIGSSTNKSSVSASLVTGRRVYQLSSAPINIPDWSKKSGAKEEDEGEDEDCKVPPHEWIAKKLARSQVSSFSVCEGVGRTLKGRDLSKVRNAVLTRTGFLE